MIKMTKISEAVYQKNIETISSQSPWQMILIDDIVSRFEGVIKNLFLVFKLSTIHMIKLMTSPMKSIFPSSLNVVYTQVYFIITGGPQYKFKGFGACIALTFHQQKSCILVNID